MKIGSVLENQKIEKRIAITPEIAKKYISLGFDVQLSKNYGTHLGITDAVKTATDPVTLLVDIIFGENDESPSCA